jgi:hypothetical protein
MYTVFFWMPLQGSNLDFSESKSDVLPITPRGNKLVGVEGFEPTHHLRNGFTVRCALSNSAAHPKLVDPVGLEPTTYRLKARCSTY